MLRLSVVSGVLLALALYEMCGQSSASVISVDFGSEWIKVALVKVRYLKIWPSLPYVITGTLSCSLAYPWR